MLIIVSSFLIFLVFMQQTKSEVATPDLTWIIRHPDELKMNDEVLITCRSNTFRHAIYRYYKDGELVHTENAYTHSLIRFRATLENKGEYSCRTSYQRNSTHWHHSPHSNRVQVEVVCDAGWHGDGCSYECQCAIDEPSCDSYTGTCPSDCQFGWTGQACQPKCVDGRFGVECRQECHCADSLDCDKISGECPSQCAPGWSGPDCQQSHLRTECQDGKFGVECRQECHCAEQAVCDKISGECPSQCAPGWMGHNCQLICDRGNFGPECGQECHCADGLDCDKISGECPSQCAPGLTGHNCQQSHLRTEVIVNLTSSVSSGQTVVGLPVNLTCVTYPPVTDVLYSFYKDNIRVWTDTSNVFSFTAVVSDSGFYSCNIHGATNTSRSDELSLTVIECDCGIHECEARNEDFTCKCLWGYETFRSPKNCQDIDECERNSSNQCGELNICENMEGGYICKCLEEHQESIGDRICSEKFVNTPEEESGRNSFKIPDDIQVTVAIIALSIWVIIYCVYNAIMMWFTIVMSIYRFIKTEPYFDGSSDDNDEDNGDDRGENWDEDEEDSEGNLTRAWSYMSLYSRFFPAIFSQRSSRWRLDEFEDEESVVAANDHGTILERKSSVLLPLKTKSSVILTPKTKSSVKLTSKPKSSI